jgi:hypothetical protein
MEEEIEFVLAEAPEFLALYRKLVIDADGHPGAAATFAELARYVTWLLDEAERSHISLTRCLDAVEKVVKTSENAEDLVVWSFFEGLGNRDVPPPKPLDWTKDSSPRHCCVRDLAAVNSVGR